jgi:hypothetical protein
VTRGGVWFSRFAGALFHHTTVRVAERIMMNGTADGKLPNRTRNRTQAVSLRVPQQAVNDLVVD